MTFTFSVVFIDLQRLFYLPGKLVHYIDCYWTMQYTCISGSNVNLLLLKKDSKTRFHQNLKCLLT